MPSSPRTPVAQTGPAAPRHAVLWATFTYAVVTLLVAWPALTGGFLVNPRSDQYIAGFPFRDFAGQALKAGQGIPQWNPYLFGGMPYIAAMHGDIFYPTALLRLLFPTDVGMTWGLIIHVFLCGCFTYGFLRAWGLGFFPSLIGGIAFMFSGNVAGLVSPGHDGKLFVSALMPLALWLLVRGVRDDKLWAWGGLALTIGLAVLTPHPQLLQYMLLTCGAFGAYVAFGTRPDGTRLPRNVAIKRLAYALGSVVLGFAIGAVQYLPVMEYIPFSPRSGGKGYEYATSFSLPVEELLNAYLPQFSGILDKYWGRNNIHLHSEYLGAVVLLLASAAFGGESRKGFRRFWLATLIVSVLWALGGNTPFYQLIYAIVPGTKFFRAPSTMLMVVAMATAVLAALGTERLLERELSRRFIYGWLAGATIVAVLASVGVFTVLAQSIASGFASGRGAEYISENQSALIVGAWRSLLCIVAAAAIYLAYERRRVDARMLAWALAAIVAIDLWSIDRYYWLFSPRASVVYGSDPAIEYLKKAPIGRVLATPFSRDGLAYHDPNFGYDGLMVHRIRVANGYHGNEIGRYRSLISTDGSEQYDNLVNPALWRLGNVRYLYTNNEINQPGIVKILGPAKTAAGSTLYLYRLPGDNPPAWIAPAIVKAGDPATLGTIMDPRFDPLRAAIIDTNSTQPAQVLTALPERLQITPKVTRYEPGHIAADLSAPAPAGSILVVSENFYPGWTATVDGKAAPVVRTDYTLIGIPLPAGASRISLDYADPAYGTGKVVTWLAVLVALGLVAGGIFAERRRSVV